MDYYTYLMKYLGFIGGGGLADPYPGNIIINPSFDDGGDDWLDADSIGYNFSGGNASVSGDGFSGTLINSVNVNSAGSYTVYVDFSWNGNVFLNLEMYLDAGGFFFAEGLGATGSTNKTGSGRDIFERTYNADGSYNRPGIIIAFTGVASVTIHGIYLVPN